MDKYDPLHCIEIITFDSTGKVNKGHIAKESDNPLQLPYASVGRIYTTNVDATGFACRSKNGEIVVVSCKHTYGTPFDAFSECSYHITFSMEHCYVRDILTSHSEHPVYRRLKYIENQANVFETQSDPITNSLCTVPNDIAVFEIENICICGAPVTPFADDPIEITDFIPGNETQCVLLGYPGIFTIDSVTLIKNIGDDIEILSSMKGNELVWTEGKVLKVGELIAISNSSVPGMSGSPMLVKCETGEWKAFGMLLGGPAVFGHFQLYTLAGHYGDDALYNKFINEIIPEPRDLLASTVLFHISTARNIPKRACIKLLETCYYTILRIRSSILSPEETMHQLNHNLALPLAPYKSII